MAENALEMKGIYKKFLGAYANENVEFTVKKGEIHALLGENGAGKTTLMNILTGLYRPDDGEIWIDGKIVHITSPKDAIEAGIGMVHQHFKLVDTLTVAENIILGWHSPKFRIDKRKIEDEIREVSKKYDIAVEPSSYIHKISAGERQRVEILKVLYRGANLIILDEPTSVLTESEASQLFKALHELVGQGKTVIFISHKLNEVMQVSDRITVLRNAKNVITINKEDTNATELTKYMTGTAHFEFSKRTGQRIISENEVVMKAESISVLGDMGETSVDNVSFSINKGEIFGIAGISGNGQSYLAKAVTGLKPLRSGTLIIDGCDLSNSKSLDFIKAGVSHVPEDRVGTGLVPNYDCTENLMLKSYRNEPVRKGLRLDKKAGCEICNKLMEDYDVKIAAPDVPAKILSGGNMQKIIIARELACNPKIIVAVHPTYGLDVGTIEKVRSFLLKASEDGVAVLLISEDLSEVLDLSDSVAVMYKGTLSEKYNRGDISFDEVSCLMMGVSKDSGQEVGTC